jgi:hypothetical protein
VPEVKLTLPSGNRMQHRFLPHLQNAEMLALNFGVGDLKTRSKARKKSGGQQGMLIPFFKISI